MKLSTFPYFFLLLVLFATFSSAQNPIIMDQFTADPTARVFNGKVYLYPSHDVVCAEGQGFVGFCMPDYHVFSSENLTDWKDHGMILSHNTVPWVERDSYRMWAPECVYKDGKYYYYFPAEAPEKINGKGRRIGVAIGDKPEGPFIPETNYIAGIYGIDPTVFIAKDGKAYIYWANDRVIYGAQLKPNMLELATLPVPIKIKGIGNGKFIEGPFVFERNGQYYLTFPYIPETIEQLVYSIGTNPLGPFDYKGIIMKESPTKCYTNHQSIVDYKGQSYLFYHHNDLSPNSDKRRSVKAEMLFFNPDGTIQEVIPSLRGVGVSRAESQIQMDRYSEKSETGISSSFVDELNTFKGWKVVLNQKNAWVRYNNVDFSNKGLKKLKVMAKNLVGASFEIRTKSLDGPLIGTVNLNKSADWCISTLKLTNQIAGLNDIFIISTSNNPFEVDWITFE